jgi:N-acetylneuraminic acid mutarotase
MSATVAPNGNVFIAAGFHAEVGRTFYPDLLVYHPGSDTYSSLPPMQSARSTMAGAIANDGRLFLFGGTANVSGSEVAIGTTEVYDPGLGTWSYATPLPYARTGARAVTGPNGKIYVIGGHAIFAGITVSLSTVDVYDPATERWSAATSMSQGRDEPGVVVGADGLIYAMGGYDYTSGAMLASVEAYDYASDVWYVLPPLPTPRYAPRCCGDCGRIHLCGGWSRKFRTRSHG